MGLGETAALYRRMFSALPRTHKTFIWLVLAQCIYICFERSYVLAVSLNDDRRVEVWFFVVVLVSVAFVLYFAVHAVLHVNRFELMAFLVASVMMLLRIVIEYTSRADSCRASGVCITMLAITICFNIVHWIMFVRMEQDLKWKKYKAIGADPATRRLYLRYELFSAMRKVDLQFSMILLITGLIFFLDSHDRVAGLVPNIILFGVELVWEHVGLRGVKTQSKTLMIVFWVLSTFLPIFIISVTIESLSASQYFNTLKGNQESATVGSFAVLSIISRIITVITSITLFTEFGPGYQPLLRVLNNRSAKFLNSGRRQQPKATSRAAAGGADSDDSDGEGAPEDEEEAGVRTPHGNKKPILDLDWDRGAAAISAPVMDRHDTHRRPQRQQEALAQSTDVINPVHRAPMAPPSTMQDAEDTRGQGRTTRGTGARIRNPEVVDRSDSSGVEMPVFPAATAESKGAPEAPVAPRRPRGNRGAPQTGMHGPAGSVAVSPASSGAATSPHPGATGDGGVDVDALLSDRTKRRIARRMELERQALEQQQQRGGRR